MARITLPTKVITGKDTRWSYCNAWEPKAINGGTPKYSVSLIIPKSAYSLTSFTQAESSSALVRIAEISVGSSVSGTAKSYFANSKLYSARLPITLVEQRLDFSKYVPEGFGTGDCVIVADDVLHIVDFKYRQL